MSQIQVFGGTDTGQIRQANEDAFHRGETVFAVADGMGGHLAGEIASATALESVVELDGKIFPDPDAAVTALVEAVERANAEVSKKAADDPRYRGMGTTLTAVLIEGRRLHLAHVGDSRAYLLRNGQLNQITRDHTLVQHLIDEGQITREEALTHPQRSIITRAIGVGRDVEVDSLSVDLQDGDQFLLCSDGLTGVVGDDEIAARLRPGDPPDETVTDLIRRANEEGGPDNVTVILLRYGEVTTATSDDTGELTEDERPKVIVSSSQSSEGGDWARRLGTIGALGRDHQDGHFGDDDAEPGTSRFQRSIAVAIVLALLLVVGLAGGRWLLSRSYYVGVEEGQIAVFQGVPATIGPIELSWVSEVTDVAVDQTPDFFQRRLDEGIPAADENDAQRIIESAPRRDAVADPNATTDPSASESATPQPTTSP